MFVNRLEGILGALQLNMIQHHHIYNLNYYLYYF